MSAQTTYNFSSPIGSPGGLVDLAPHAIDTFLNGENTGVLKFGVGVVQGATPGTDIKLPTSTSTAAKFEGITVNNRTTEYDVEGKAHLRKGKATGVLKYGRIYARVAADAAPAYGDALYLIPTGDEAGYFTKDADNGETGDAKVSYIAIKGRFLGAVDSTAQVAPVELYNTPNS